MQEDKESVYHVCAGVGIAGVASFSTSVGVNSKRTVIERYGSMVVNVIPAVIVICEDSLSRKLIEMVAEETNGAYRILTAGSWNNLPTLLYGIHFYREQLQATGDVRFLEVVCVADGDVRLQKLNVLLETLHQGNHVPEDMKNALALAKNDIHQFSFEKLPNIKGIPEYYHQKWLNEVSQEIVDAHHKEQIEKLNFQAKHAKEEILAFIEIELTNLKKEMDEVKQIADASRELPHYDMKDEAGLVDCHIFYRLLKDKLYTGDTLMNYPLHRLEYSVLSIIRKYNPTQWQSYIAPIKDAMEKAFEHHVEMFKHDRFNQTDIHG